MANGIQSISIGTGNNVTGNYSGAFGDPSTVSGTGSYAFGNNHTISGDSSVAIGLNNNIAQNGTFVLGNRVTTTQANSVVLGADSTDRAPSTGATAQTIFINGVTRTYAGPASATNGIISVGAVGKERQIINVAAGDVSATSTDAINGSQLAAVIGGLTHYYSVNDGGTTGDNYNNDGASGLNSIAAGVESFAADEGGVAIGFDSGSEGVGAVSIGLGADAQGDNAVSIGTDASSNENAIAIGNLANARRSQSIAIGDNSFANATKAVAFGDNATASASNAVAIGSGASSTIANSVALGNGAQTAAAVGTSTAATSTGIAYPVSGSFAGNAPTGTVSIGTLNNERTLTNVAAGRISSTSTDGINGSQLYAVAELAGTGWNVQSNGDTASKVAPGDTVQFLDGQNIDITRSGNNITIATAADLVSDSLTINSGPTINNAGINMGSKTITNLAAGVNPTDAVNVSQLTTAIGTVAFNFSANSGGTVSRTNGQTLAINGVGSAGGTYSGANLKTVADPATGAINIQMTDAPEFASVTTGNTTINNTGLTIVGGPSVTTAGINAANTAITNVAPGVAGTDAVNVNQLNTVSNVANLGWDMTTGATGSGVASGTSLETVKPGEQVTYQAGDNLRVTQTGNTVNYSLNPVLTGLASVSVTGGPIIDNTGINMGNKTITNLAAGVNPTDAVNVSQLTNAIGSVSISYSGNSGGVISRNSGQTLAIQGAATTAGTYSGGNVKTVTDPVTGAVNIQIADAPKFGTVTINDGGSGKITGVTTGTISNTSQDAVNGSQMFALGTSIATGLGGGTVYNATTGAITTSIAVGGINYTTVQDAIQAVSTARNTGINLTTKAVGTGTVSGSNVQSIASGSTATFTAGNNIAITQLGSEVQIAVNPNMQVESVAIAGGPTIDNRGITMSAGDMLDMGGNMINNLAAGVNGTDAVNVSQLNTGLDKMLSTANAYTDTQINALNFDLSTFKKDANAGTASAMAMAAVPQAFEPGMGIVGGGVSTWMGQHAIAVGFSKASDNGRVIIKASGTVNSRGKGGASAGVGFQF